MEKNRKRNGAKSQAHRRRRDGCAPGKLGHVHQDDVDSFACKRSSGVAACRATADDQDLGVLEMPCQTLFYLDRERKTRNMDENIRWGPSCFVLKPTSFLLALLFVDWELFATEPCVQAWMTRTRMAVRPETESSGPWTRCQNDRQEEGGGAQKQRAGIRGAWSRSHAVCFISACA